MEASIGHHHLKFFRKHGRKDVLRGECSCGWNSEGTPERVYALAAGHDLPPLPVGVTAVSLDNPADLHNTLKRILGE